jgi:hypothetical protein
MPQFEVLSRQEAMMNSSTGKRSQVIQEYAAYIARLGRDEAGKITPSEGESIATIRRRLGTAVRNSGKSIQMKRVGNDIYFWEDPPKSRGGRPRKNPEA